MGNQVLTDVRQVPGSFETRIAPFIGLGNGKSRLCEQEAVEAGVGGDEDS
jgi:hypothetical protein